MHRTIPAALCGLFLAAGSVMAQGGQDVLDILRVKVRFDKSAEYEENVKKLAEINRKYKGDHWLALSTEYGEQGTFTFSSPRENMAAIETAAAAFENALKEGLGAAGAKLMQSLNADSASVETELRRRRWDLSVHPPEDAVEQAKTVAHARWIRSLRVALKPGKSLEFATAWKPLQAQLEKVYPPVTIWASEVTTGTPAIYFATYLKNLGELDAAGVAVQSVLGSEEYRRLMVGLSDLAFDSRWEIYRLRPELSCVPDELAALDPAFWRPAPPATAVPKPKPAAAAPGKK